MDERLPSPGAGRRAAILFALVALLALGALALTQELRSRPDVVNTVKVRRAEDGTMGKIRFRLTKDEGRATLAIVDPNGLVVAEPVSDAPLAAGEITAEWDGKVEAGGTPAPAGRYRVRFTFEEQDRRAFLPGRIRIGEPR